MSDDARFLERCGIEVDQDWLMEIFLEEAPPEVSHHLCDLKRISEMPPLS
jgi:hypothetical protein